MNDWISVRTCQPRLWKEVLLHHADGTILIGERFRFGYLNEDVFGKVTHWMPLPAPPV